MSKYRPHVRNAGNPPISDKSLLMGRMTPQQKAAWLRLQSKEVQEAAVEQGQRYDLIKKATVRGLLDWSIDYRHYRNGSPYCQCPVGTVDGHNERFLQILRSVDDGR